MIQTGKIEAVQLSTGELLVAAEHNGHKPKTKKEIIAEKFSDLQGVPISPYSAQKKYGGIHRNNFIKWARSGYIEILKEDDRLIELNEADVAYCAQIYSQKKEEYGGKIAGVRVFDEMGNPYQVKYPDLAAKRRG